ncbi:MAG: LamG domain-containing protein [Phycisphaerae bacterium]|nr:LamG domain-containing protein [Phycisphaerae bacterium]
MRYVLQLNCLMFVLILLICSVAKAELIANWTMEAGSDTSICYDVSTNDYHGVLKQYSDASSVWTEGHDGQALEFDGIDDRVEFSSATVANGFGFTNSVTMALWVKTSGSINSKKCGLVLQGPAGADHTQGNKILAINADGAVSLLANSVGELTSIATSTVVTDGQWHHIVATIDFESVGDNDTLKIYIDGVLEVDTDVANINRYNSQATDFIMILGSVTGNTSWDSFQGLMDDVRFYNHTLTQDEIIQIIGDVTLELTPANNSSPVDEAIDIELNPTLIWQAGNYAVSHNIYFGDDYDSVLNAGLLSQEYKGNTAESSFTPGLLQNTTAYYWRVDEINSELSNSPLKGNVWAFTVIDEQVIEETESVIIEDFDQYNDTDDMLTAWANDGNATVMHDFMGWLCMQYNNDSQVTLQFDQPMDWDLFGMQALALQIKCDSDNTAGQIYVEISDGINIARIYNVAANAITNPQWAMWNISFADIAGQGVELDAINSLLIGVISSGAGSICIDDISLYPQRCLAENLSAIDLDENCIVDLLDLQLMLIHWMASEYTVTAMMPAEMQLIAHYQFEQTSGLLAIDSSSNHFDGQIDADTDADIWNVAGYNGTCLFINGQYNLTLPAAIHNALTDSYTISMWTKDALAEFTQNDACLYYEAGKSQFKDKQWDIVQRQLDSECFYSNNWQHLAIVKNVVTGLLAVYINGELVARNHQAFESLDTNNAGDIQIGSSDPGTTSTSSIYLDELKIYSYDLTQSEIVYIVAGYDAHINQPLSPVLSTFDPVEDGVINLSDFVLFDQYWLLEQVWPLQ